MTRRNLASTIYHNKEIRQSVLKDAFMKTDESLRQRSFNTSFSGSTAVTVMILGDKLICANTGDSRAILGTQKTVHSAQSILIFVDTIDSK